MTIDEQKKQAALAAADYLTEQWVENDWVVGVGTGSTANFFIDALAKLKGRFDAAVSSSDISTRRLQAAGIQVLELNAVGPIPIYIDGADESNRQLQLIKGGGGALTREKIVAAAAERFVCIADESKLVDQLGRFPLPIEVIPMARSYVARRCLQLGGQPVWREGFTTDNGNLILDVHGLDLAQPQEQEQLINNIAGVVTVGLFAQRPADLLLLAGKNGVQTLSRS